MNLCKLLSRTTLANWPSFRWVDVGDQVVSDDRANGETTSKRQDATTTDKAAAGGEPKATVMKMYQQVFENNRKWVAETKANDPDFFSRLAKAQNPDFLYIGCADSRVPASVIMDLEPGDVFVHRNVANLVVNTDLNSQSVIEYAVTHLGVKHVIVCGHYGCGGVKAAMQSKDLGQLNGWLREIRDVFRTHHTKLLGIKDDEARYRRLVELNVREQCINVIKTPCVQKAFMKTGYPTVHGWVYSLDEGLLHDIDVPFAEVLSNISEIYHLDETD
jgi:carbonic anhydrase